MIREMERHRPDRGSVWVSPPGADRTLSHCDGGPPPTATAQQHRAHLGMTDAWRRAASYVPLSASGALHDPGETM
jgi:hypothetical protein